LVMRGSCSIHTSSSMLGFNIECPPKLARLNLTLLLITSNLNTSTSQPDFLKTLQLSPSCHLNHLTNDMSEPSSWKAPPVGSPCWIEIPAVDVQACKVPASLLSLFSISLIPARNFTPPSSHPGTSKLERSNILRIELQCGALLRRQVILLMSVSPTLYPNKEVKDSRVVLYR
jgi:hypothetical protein